MINLIIIILIILVVLMMCNKNMQKDKKDKKIKENLTNITNPFVDGLSQSQLGSKIPDNSQILSKPKKPSKYFDIINNVLDENGKKISSSNINCKKLNKYFISSQFSDNYRDVMTALHNISPNQKQLFNLQMLPVTTTLFDPAREPPLEIIKLVVQFISQLNTEIKQLPESQDIINDYNNYLPMTSQMNKFVKNRGINYFYNEGVQTDFSLYPDTPMNSPVELIKVLSAEKQFTEAETKYVISFAIEKVIKSVSEQMKITVHFILENNPLEGETLFDNIENSSFTRTVAVEYIFTDGFFSDKFNKNFDCYGTDNTDKNNTLCDMGNHYNFDNLNQNTMISDNQVIKSLNKKNREHMLEMMNFNTNIPYPVYNNPEFKRPPSFS